MNSISLGNLLSGVQEEIGFAPIPNGNYNVVIDGIESKTTKSGGKALNFKLKVVEGTFKNRVIFDWVNIAIPTSEIATNIGKSRLKKIAIVSGANPDDLNTGDMLGKIITVYVAIEMDDRGPRNRVKGYEVSKGVTGVVTSISTPAITASDIPF